jgi:hypothetical protein
MCSNLALPSKDKTQQRSKKITGYQTIKFYQFILCSIPSVLCFDCLPYALLQCPAAFAPNPAPYSI